GLGHHGRRWMGAQDQSSHIVVSLAKEIKVVPQVSQLLAAPCVGPLVVRNQKQSLARHLLQGELLLIRHESPYFVRALRPRRVGAGRHASSSAAVLPTCSDLWCSSPPRNSAMLMPRLGSVSECHCSTHGWSSAMPATR